MELAIVNFCTSPEGNRFMPKPGELIAALEGNATQQAQQAWTKIINAIRHVGGDATVIFDDPLIHSVLHDMGVWIRLCGMYSKDEPLNLIGASCLLTMILLLFTRRAIDNFISL